MELDDSIRERYQQIQALSPSDPNIDQVSETPLPVSTFLSLSLFIFFFVVIFLGFLPLVLERFRDFKRFQMAILLAFVSAALPLSMGLLFQRSGLLTRASVEETPRNVEVNVEDHTFRVSWETVGDQFGAVRYGDAPFSSAMTQTVLEVDGLEKTTDHEVMVKNLDEDNDYYFEILSGSLWYNNQGAMLHVYIPAEE